MAVPSFIFLIICAVFSKVTFACTHARARARAHVYSTRNGMHVKIRGHPGHEAWQHMSLPAEPPWQPIHYAVCLRSHIEALFVFLSEPSVTVLTVLPILSPCV